MPNILLIYRAERYSPNAVDRDKAILDAVAERAGTSPAPTVGIACRGGSCAHPQMMEEDDFAASPFHAASPFSALPRQCLVIHMTRSKAALEKLAELEQRGATVINAPAAILNCNRKRIEEKMLSIGLPTPARLVEQHPELGGKGWWIKAADTADSSESHVQFLPASQPPLPAVPPQVSANTLIQPHIEGQCLKFYGVLGTDFFHIRDTEQNGRMRYAPTVPSSCRGVSHTPPIIPEDIRNQLHRDATALAQALGLQIYGGDAILTKNNLLTIIDFNDFPSFSGCQEEAAEAITQIVCPLKNY